MARACWFDGEMVDPDAAAVSVFDHGLLYGDGVFEGIRFYDGVPFRLEAHLRRLERSARALHLDLPFSRDELAAATRQTALATGEADGYLRLVVTRGRGALGIDPRTCETGSVFVLADRLQMVSDAALREGAKLIVASTRRTAVDQLDSRVKSLNYLNQILARIEANHGGADEAVVLNRDGFVAEGTADNLFIVCDGVLLTPPVTDGALDGITRQVVLELAAAEGVPAREQRLAVYDLLNADECFLTGTGAELIPVGQIQGQRVGSGERPVYERLQAAFTRLVRAEVAQAA
jgi:branched-chain amino acid aminotransferase